jgi:signal transduction histidine kinase
MHDDLGSGLTKISYLSESILKKGNDDVSLHKIQDTSLDLIKNMSEIIWALKVENDSLRQLQSYTKRYAYEYLESNNLELDTRMVESDLLDEITVSGENRRSIFLMVKEALHNIVKHANCTKVEISTELDENYIIRICDNGIGFSSGNRENGNGISSMKRRAEKLGGTIKFSLDQGTHIEISLPVKGIET